MEADCLLFIKETASGGAEKRLFALFGIKMGFLKALELGECFSRGLLRALESF